MIDDPKIRKAIEDINKRLDRIESIPQMSRTSSLPSVIDAINKITKSLKRSR